MTKLLLAMTLVAFVAVPAKACDWNREARSSDPAVATTATPSQPAASQTATTAAPATNVATEESARKPADQPVVLITDRH